MEQDHDTTPTPAPSSYVKAKCSDCGNEQIVFRRASTHVVCTVCSTPLATPGGGVATFHGEIVESLE